MSIQLEVDGEISLRLMRPEQAPVLALLIEQNRDFLRQWLPWVDQSRGAADTAVHIDHWWRAYGRGLGFSLGLFARGELAGIIGFHGFDDANRITSLGYWMGARHTGLGLMTRSVARLLDYAIEERDMNRIFIRCATANTKSRAIPERLGFRHEGTQREAEWLYDHYVDLEVYAILAREWKRQRARPTTPLP